MRVLFSIDTARTDLAQGRGFGRVERADRDYALAWVKPHGRSRVFYCTIAHHPEVFQDPRLLRFYLAAVQFVMGDLPGPVEPSQPRPFTGPGGREDTAWRLRQMKASRGATLFEQIQRAAELGQAFLAVSGTQRVSAAIPKPFGPGLSAEERAAVRLELAKAGLRIALYAPEPFPTAPERLAAACRFARRLGATTLAVPSPAPERALLEQLCAEWDLTFHECLPALKPTKPTP